MQRLPHRGRILLTLWLILSFHADPLLEITTVRHIYLAKAIVETGSFEVTSYAHASRGDLAVKDGRVYSGSLPLMGLLLVPHAAVAGMIAPHLPLNPKILLQLLGIIFLTAPAAAMAAVLVAEAVMARVDGRRTAWLAAAFLFGTPFFFFTTKLTDYPVTALLHALLLRSILAEQSRPSFRQHLLQGVVLGATLLINDFTFAVTALFLFVATLPESSRRFATRWLSVAAAALPFLLFRFAYLQTCFGSPFANPTAYSATPTTIFSLLGPDATMLTWAAAALREFPAILWGITFGDVGIFFFAPLLLLLAVPLIPSMRLENLESGSVRVARAAVLAFLANLALHFILIGGTWSGGASWGPRYLLYTWTFATFAALLLSGRTAPRLLLGLAAISVAINWIGVQYGYNTSIIDEIGLFLIGGPTLPAFRMLWLHWAVTPTPERIALVMEETPRIGHYHAFTHPSPFLAFGLLVILLLILWRPVLINLDRQHTANS